MRNREQEKLVLQVEAQQRNIVSPDTVENEGEFYRGIATRPPTSSLKIGFSPLAAMEIWAVKVALTLGTIFGGAGLFMRILYLAVRLGVHQFAAQTSWTISSFLSPQANIAALSLLNLV